MDEFEGLRVEAPALAAFMDSLEEFFYGMPALRTRLQQGFLAADRRMLCRSLAALERQGVFPALDPQDDQQVTALWKSDFYRVYLEAIGFYPPADGKPLDELLPPARDLEEVCERAWHLDRLFPEMDFWRSALKRTYPEIFLHPYLDRRKGSLRGCDLACGWGRATLALRDYEGLHVHCCDRSPRGLALLRALCYRSGLSRHVTTCRCEIFELPFEDDSLDFTIAFDVFELLTDPFLDRVLRELLRCHKRGAVLYGKVALYAFVPSLGQVQYFTRRELVDRFTGVSCEGKRFRVLRSDLRLPEHISLEVT